MDKQCPISGSICRDDCTFLRNDTIGGEYKCDMARMADGLYSIAESMKGAVDYLAIIAEESTKPMVIGEKDE